MQSGSGVVLVFGVTRFAAKKSSVLKSEHGLPSSWILRLKASVFSGQLRGFEPWG